MNKSELVKYVYERETDERYKVLGQIFSFFNGKNYKKGEGRDYDTAFGKLYINIHTFFQEDDNGFSANEWLSPEIYAMGNINGKMSKELFWKDKETKELIEMATRQLRNIAKEKDEAINQIDKDYPDEKVCYASIHHKVNNGTF